MALDHGFRINHRPLSANSMRVQRLLLCKEIAFNGLKDNQSPNQQLRTITTSLAGVVTTDGQLKAQILSAPGGSIYSSLNDNTLW